MWGWGEGVCKIFCWMRAGGEQCKCLHDARTHAAEDNLRFDDSYMDEMPVPPGTRALRRPSPTPRTRRYSDDFCCPWPAPSTQREIERQREKRRERESTREKESGRRERERERKSERGNQREKEREREREGARERAGERERD